MRARLIELHRRRALLVAQAAAEREQLAGYLERADAALAWLGRARGAFARAGQHPLLIAAAAVLIVVWRPRRVLKLLAGGWSLWRLYRRAQRLWTRFAPLLEPDTRARA
jgi:hypothetical protein